jgi:hypothetical protein
MKINDSNVCSTVEVSWELALRDPSTLAWGRIADGLWFISNYILNMEVRAGVSATDYEDALSLYEIANWRSFNADKI